MGELLAAWSDPPAELPPRGALTQSPHLHASWHAVIDCVHVPACCRAQHAQQPVGGAVVLKEPKEQQEQLRATGEGRAGQGMVRGQKGRRACSGPMQHAADRRSGPAAGRHPCSRKGDLPNCNLEAHLQRRAEVERRAPQQRPQRVASAKGEVAAQRVPPVCVGK